MPEILKPKRVFHETVGRGISQWREFGAAQKLALLEEGDHFPILDVPYISQIANADKDLISERYGDIKDEEAMDRFGAQDLDEFSYWAWRSCGIAGVKMGIRAVQGSFFKKKTMDLVNEGLELGGYDVNNDVGWYHDSLVQLSKNHGINAFTDKFVPSSEIARLIARQNFVLASIDSDVGGHLLFIYGFRIGEDGRLEGFWHHDPNDFDKNGESQYISKSDFDKKSTRRIVAMAPAP